MSESKQTWEFPAAGIAGERKASVPESLFKRMLRKIFPDQRKQVRLAAPPAVGFLGTMNGSRPFEVGDVSLGGFRLKTVERWAAGTEMPITLQRTSAGPDQHDDHFTMQATVVRWTDDGIAFSIVLSEEESSAVFDNPLHVWWASRQEMQLFLDRLSGMYEKRPAIDDLQSEVKQRAPLNPTFGQVLNHGAGD